MVTKKLLEANLDNLLYKSKQSESPVYCIDSNPVTLFENNLQLLFPGGDLGIFFSLNKTIDSYGFELDKKKIKQIYTSIFGKNLITHNQDTQCCFINLINASYKNYKKDQLILTPDKFYSDPQFAQVFNKFSAIIINKTEYVIYPMIKDLYKKTLYLLIFNQKLLFNKIKSLSNLLFGKKAIKPLYSADLDEIFFYQMLTTEVDFIFWEAITNKYKKLPIFELNHKHSSKSPSIEFLGQIKNDKI